MPHKSEPASKSILLMYGAQRELTYFKKKLAKYAPHSEIYEVCVKTKDNDLMPVFEKCCQLIEAFNISVILNRPENGSILESALLSRYPFRGPSFQSSFLTLSKRYTREIIAAPLDLNMPFAVLTEADDLGNLQNILGSLPSEQKVIAKPIFENTSNCLKVMESKDEVLSSKFLSTLNDLKTGQQYLLCKSVISEFLKDNSYSIDQGYMIEMYAEKDLNIATFHGVDGLVYKKTFIPWCIRDHLFWSQRRECHIGTAFPSSLPAQVQERVWKIVASLAERMIQFGFDHQFFEAELIIFKTGKIALMEINGRMPMTMTSNAYVDILENGDPTATVLAMADDKVIEPPTLKKGMHGLFGYVSMLNKAKVSDVIDIEKMRECDSVDLDVDEDAIIDATNKEAGVILAYLNVTGNSRMDCLQQAKNIIEDFTKIKDSSPWFTDEYLVKE